MPVEEQNDDQAFAQILTNIWAMLERGATNRHDAFHTPVFGTVADGEPRVRVVVLRKFLSAERALVWHSDLRSPKINEIRENSTSEYLFYHPEQKIQLRVRGESTIHTADELADDQWANSQLFSRRCYCGDAPSSPSDEPTSGLPAFLEDRQPTEEESETMGHHNFCVIKTNIARIDYLSLAFSGNQRALFVFGENGNLETRWLTP